MGISSVAVYADGECHEPFVKEADCAIALAGSSARQTYLDVDKILAAAEIAQADAIHPGYGFLAENANFAEAVIAAGLTWVGPSPSAIAAMGDKLSAKQLMQRAGVPLLPSAKVQANSDLAALVAEIGLPMLVKASAGGGGKGMRVVRDASQVEVAIQGAQREAESAVGDATVFLERWLEKVRHVEIQVLADTHGHIVHLFERECSIQRRHQKVIEEAPSPAVHDALRQSMCEAAIAAAKAIDYSSTGTVEFLLQGETFWFLEMNTRLQVEHALTEAITGIDLVREQLRIAQGETLSFRQDQISMNGHAIEARLYAEDPENDFLPATGNVVAWTPASDPHVRFDAGIETGSSVNIEFDPMLAKVIAHAPTRLEATNKLTRALATTRLQGLTTNRDFLLASLRTPAFGAGDTTTDFIQRMALARRFVPSEAAVHDACIAAAMYAQAACRAAAPVLATLPSGWRNSPMPLERRSYRCAEQVIELNYRRQRSGDFACFIGDRMFQVRILGHDAHTIVCQIDERRIAVEVLPVRDKWFVHGRSTDIEITELPRFPEPHFEVDRGGLSAPMPGKVVDVSVAIGEAVAAGQQLLVLEAMKMEHRITAPVSGTVTQLLVSLEQQVAHGELLVVVEE